MNNLYMVRPGVYAETPDARFERMGGDIEPQLMVMLYALEEEAAARGQTIVYTSIWRPADKDSLHSMWRAADVRIWHPDRGINKTAEGAGLREDSGVLPYLRDAFGMWKGGDGALKDPFLVHGEGLHRHVHVQCPAGPWAR